MPSPLWVVSAPPVEDSFGQVANMSGYAACFPGPGGAAPGGTPQAQVGHPAHGTPARPLRAARKRAYQPASHYWPLQWYETALFVAVALALALALALAGVQAGLCFWWIGHRKN